MVELYLHFPICLHGIVLNCLTTGTAFLLSSALCTKCTHNGDVLVSLAPSLMQLDGVGFSFIYTCIVWGVARKT
jgi:hypothetical protein